MKLGVIADTRHHLDGEGRPCTLEPVAAQLEVLAAMFESVVLLVPLWPGPAPPGFRAYRAPNVTVRPVRPAGGATLLAKASFAVRVPQWAAAMTRLLGEVDAVHLRCPSNIGGVGIVAAALSRRHRTAMYAGSWAGYPGEPLTYRLQRHLLGRPSFGGPVTVYSAGSPTAPHVVPFFSPTFTLADWEAESAAVTARLAALAGGPRRAPVRLVTVGHLDENKNQAVVLAAVKALHDLGIDARLDVAGDGPERHRLERLALSLDIAGAVGFHGRLPHGAVRDLYRAADFNVLASRTEGYPKVLVEGMVAGAVPVTSPFPLSASMLGHGQRGAEYDAGRPAGRPAALAGAVAALAGDPSRVAGMVRAGREYAATVTLDAFGARMRTVLEEAWGSRLLDRREQAV